jgi:hypothetical protein
MPIKWRKKILLLNITVGPLGSLLLLDQEREGEGAGREGI